MEKEIIETHSEIIECPECKKSQAAIVEHTFPWWSYVHNCTNCGYVIMESEWNKITIAEIEKILLESIK